MALSTSITLTVSDYDIKLSRNLKFYENDQLKLIFTLNYWGIDNANGVTQKVLMPLNALSAILFIETPLGVDSIESATIEENVVTFYLTSNQTQYIGISRMQIQLSDADGCQITLPPMEFEVRENIYDDEVILSQVLLADENENVVVDENGNAINTGTQVSAQTYAVALSAENETATTTSQPTKQIKNFNLKTGVSGKEDLLIQDSDGVTKRIKASEFLNVNIDLALYYTKEEVDTLLNNKADISHTHNEYVTDSELDAKRLATETFVTNKIAEASRSGGEVDLSGLATKDELNAGLSGKANTSHSHSYNDLTNKPTIPSIDGLATKDELNTKANSAHTHEISDITNLVIPTNISDLTNDSGFITSIPGEYITETELNNKNYATTTYVNTKISEAQLGGGSGGSGGVVDTTVTTSSGGFNSDGSLDSNSSFTHIDTYVNFESVSGGTIIAGTSGWWMFIYYDADKNYIGSYNPSSANTDYSISDIHSQKSDAVYFRASINQTTTISIIGVYNIDSSVIEKNVKDYGVIGDGITDDTNSIQGIISYVGQNGGGTIIFPEGEYKVTSPILIKYSNIYLKGEIGNKINYYGNGMDLNFIYVKGEYDNKLNNVTIDGLNLDGTNQLYKGGADDSDWLLTAPNPMSVGMTAICCTYCSNLKIINNTLNDFYGNGIIVRRCSFAFIEKNFLTDCSASGMASINTDFQGDGITAFMSFGVTVSNNIVINKRTFKTHNDVGWSGLTCDVYGKQCARSGLEFEYALNTDYESSPEKWCPYSDLISDVHGYALNFKNNYVYGYNKGIHLEHSINALIEGNSILHCNIGVLEATGGHIMIVNNEFDSDGVGASPQGGYDWYYASVALPHFLGTTFNNAIITGNRFRGDAAGVTYARNYISIKDNDFRNTGLCIEQKGDNLENILIEDNKFLLQDSLSSGTEKRILSLYTFGRSSIKNNNFVCENYHGTIYARIDSSVISGNIFKNVRFDLSLYNQYNLYNIFSNNVCVETIITDTATEFNFFGSHNSVISNNTFRGTKSICKAGGDNCVLENNIYVQDNNQLPTDKNNADTISGYTIWVGSQTDYDALSAKDANTIYMIKG